MRMLLGLVAATCVSLALTRIDFRIGAFAFLLFVMAAPWLPHGPCMLAGSVLGAALASNLEFAAIPYIFPVGGFGGALCGYLVASAVSFYRSGR